MFGAPLSDDELQRLSDLLDPERLGEGAMDLVEAHGLLTALTISPEPVPEAAWLPLVEGEAPAFASAEERDEARALLRRLRGEIEAAFSDEGGELELPFEPTLGDDPENSDLRAWCLTFMEGHLLAEEAWFADDEEAVGELLLPVAALSGLLEESSELDQTLADQLAEALPDTLTDLYLFFRLPAAERRPAPAHAAPAGKNKKKRSANERE